MFFGFIVGTLCLVGLAHTVLGRGRRYAGFGHRRWGGCGEQDYGEHRWGRGDFGDGPRHRDAPGGQRGWGVIHAMMRRLDASAAQEKAIMAAVDDVRRTVRDLRGQAQIAREELARALGEPTLDPAVLASARARVETASHHIADALTAALTDIHAILDDRQRRMLGDVIASTWSSRW